MLVCPLSINQYACFAFAVSTFGMSANAFGRAFYKDQLGQEGFCVNEKSDCSWIDAFQKARQEISEWEKADGFPPSDPQIFYSDAMREKLEEVEAQFSGQ